MFRAPLCKTFSPNIPGVGVGDPGMLAAFSTFGFFALEGRLSPEAPEPSAGSGATFPPLADEAEKMKQFDVVARSLAFLWNPYLTLN